MLLESDIEILASGNGGNERISITEGTLKAFYHSW